MKHLALAATLAGALALQGCVIIDADEADDFRTEFDRSSGRTVHGALVEDSSVSIWVRSNGCTSASDFSFDVDRDSERAYSVEFRREEPDDCNRTSFSEKVTWSFEELNIPEGSTVRVEHTVRR